MLRLVFAVVGFAIVLGVLAPDLTARLIAMLEAPAPQELPPEKGGSARVMLSADRRGHFETTMTVNGKPLKAMVDTGASVIALTYEDGRALGLVRPGDRYDMQMMTANGSAKAKRVSLNTVRVGGISLNNVEAIIGQEGALGVNLLGMTFLKKLRTFEMKSGRLILEQ
jgi:aspartyl protease family protein